MTSGSPSELAIQVFARTLFKRHQLVGWSFQWDNSRNRAGFCIHDYQTISLSRKMLKACGIENTKIVLLHEVAHALVGPGHGHDRVWKRKCIEIGGDGKAKVAWEAIVNAEALDHKYVGVCVKNPDHKTYRARISRSITKGASCTKCDPSKYNPECRFIWTDRRTGRTGDVLTPTS